MHGENGVPETPDWSPEPRAWDERSCCPAECLRVCEGPQSAVYLTGTDAHIIRGSE
jgi:hypothetical protein